MIVHETSRLLLETWALEDFGAFSEVARDPEVMHYIAQGEPWPDSRIGWFMGLQRAYQETLGYCNWRLTSRADGELIGFCGLAPLPMANAPEIGWWLKPAHWGKGYASEAAEKVLDVAFSEHNLDRVVARAYRKNERSIKLMNRLGMVFERSLDTNAIGEVLLYQIDCGIQNEHI